MWITRFGVGKSLIGRTSSWKTPLLAGLLAAAACLPALAQQKAADAVAEESLSEIVVTFFPVEILAEYFAGNQR